MRRFTIAVAILFAIVAVIAVPTAQSEGETPAPPTAPQEAPQAAPQKQLRNGCAALFTKRRFKHYTTAVYLRRTLTKKAGRRITTMQRCQHSPRAERWARKVRKQLKAARRVRMTVGCGSPACNRALAMQLGGPCIVWIGDHEGSGWRTTTWNHGGSGAYGIPQALPGAKMASHGSDWATNARTQIRWMIDYVQKYGGACGAVAYWRAHHSY